jgi:hypothetical protein
MNLSQLADALDRLSQDIKIETKDYSIKYAMSLYKNLLDLSPVDTSELISNWVISLNVPTSDAIIQPYYIGKKGSTKDISLDAALNAALDVLLQKKQGDIIYISNTTPQVVYTNYGTAKITPRYFIETSMQLAIADSTNLNIELKAKT